MMGYLQKILRNGSALVAVAALIIITFWLIFNQRQAGTIALQPTSESTPTTQSIVITPTPGYTPPRSGIVGKIIVPPTPGPPTSTPIPTPTPPYSEKIQVEQVIDLKQRFVDAYQTGSLAMLVKHGLPQSIGFAGWSSDGQYVSLNVSYGGTQEILFNNDQLISVGLYDLWIYNLKTSEFQEIFVNQAGALPKWSPDNKWIALLVDSNIKDVPSYELWVYSVDQQRGHQLASEASLYFDWIDNDTLIYSSRSFGDGEGHLWKVNIADQKAHPLTVMGVANQKITAFAIARANNNIALQIAGNKLELWLGHLSDDNVTINQKIQLSDSSLLSWSSDGEMLAYAPILKSLRIIQADGTEIMQVGQTINNTTATWSTDNTKLLFSSNTDLYVVDLDKKNVWRLFSSTGSEKINLPVWSPKGQIIGFNQQDWDGVTLIELKK
jgi:tricorn protease-like protein